MIRPKSVYVACINGIYGACPTNVEKIGDFYRKIYNSNLIKTWSKLIRFARVSSYVADFNARNKSLSAKLLQQGYRYHKLRKTFSKFYRRHYELVSKFNVGLKTLLHQGLSEPEFYGDNI